MDVPQESLHILLHFVHAPLIFVSLYLNYQLCRYFPKKMDKQTLIEKCCQCLSNTIMNTFI